MPELVCWGWGGFRATGFGFDLLVAWPDGPVVLRTILRTRWKLEVWAGAVAVGVGTRLPRSVSVTVTMEGDAVDNRSSSLPPIVGESFVTPGRLSGKPGGDAVSCWRPSWQDLATAVSALQRETLQSGERGLHC